MADFLSDIFDLGKEFYETILRNFLDFKVVMANGRYSDSCPN